MAAAEAKKVVIARKMVTLLQGVTRAKGYLTDLGNNVSRRRASVKDTPQTDFPRAAVFTPESDETDGCATGFRDDATFIVEVFVLHGTEVEDEVLRAEADVKRCLLTDQTLGGLLSSIEWFHTTTDWQEMVQTGRGIAAVMFRVKHDWTAAAP